MTRIIRGSLLLVCTLFLIAIATAATPAAPKTLTCTDSWGSDGHTGPWYVGQGQSLHGNTIVVTCPNGNVAWNVDYYVEKSDGNTIAFPIKVDNYNGTGSTSFSFTSGPVGCNQGWNYWTYVHNNDTGGSLSKPSNHVNVIC